MFPQQTRKVYIYVRSFNEAIKRFSCASFRWEAGKMQLITSTVGVVGAIAALSLDLDPDSIEAKTNWILAFSAGKLNAI